VVRKIVFGVLGLGLAAAGLAVILYRPPAPPPKPKPSDHFASAKDKAFVDLASGRIARRFDTPDDVEFWDPVVSRMPNGAEALCVDVLPPGKTWVGMIAARDPGAAGFMIYRGGDTLAPKSRFQCRAIIRRGVRAASSADGLQASMDYQRAGCALDGRYLWAYVRYCAGAETLPAVEGQS